MGGGGEKSHILHSVKCFTHSPLRTRRTQQGGRNVKQVGLSMRGFPARSRPETRRPSPLIINGAAGGGTPPRGEGMGKCAKVSECAFARLTFYFVLISLSFFSLAVSAWRGHFALRQMASVLRCRWQRERECQTLMHALCPGSAPCGKYVKKKHVPSFSLTHGRAPSGMIRC